MIVSKKRASSLVLAALFAERYRVFESHVFADLLICTGLSLVIHGQAGKAMPFGQDDHQR